MFTCGPIETPASPPGGWLRYPADDTPSISIDLCSPSPWKPPEQLKSPSILPHIDQHLFRPQLCNRQLVRTQETDYLVESRRFGHFRSCDTFKHVIMQLFSPRCPVRFLRELWSFKNSAGAIDLRQHSCSRGRTSEPWRVPLLRSSMSQSINKDKWKTQFRCNHTDFG